jgi:hypothetical protein
VADSKSKPPCHANKASFKVEVIHDMTQEYVKNRKTKLLWGK